MWKTKPIVDSHDEKFDINIANSNITRTQIGVWSDTLCLSMSVIVIVKNGK